MSGAAWKRRPATFVACAALLTVTLPAGCGSVGGASEVSSAATTTVGAAADSYPTYGLWAGNVEVLPLDTAHLPPAFKEKPTAATTVRPTADDGTPPLMNIDEIKEPVWVFADQVDLEANGSAIERARVEGRPVVIYGARKDQVEQALGVDGTTFALAPDVPSNKQIWAWLPWMPNAPNETLRVMVLRTPLDDPTAMWSIMAQATLQASNESR